MPVEQVASPAATKVAEPFTAAKSPEPEVREKAKSPTPAPETPAPAPAADEPTPSSPAPAAATAAAVAAAAPGTPAPAPAAEPTPAAAPVAETKKEAEVEAPLPKEPDGIINMEIFSQIQDMDDDDDDEEGGGHEFSKGIVWGYFEQAEATFKQMEEAIAEPSLSKLSSLGHFLKGSSAALGIVKVQDSCEKMQHYGNLRDEEVGAALTEDEALKRIQQLLVDCKRDYSVASRWLRRLYGDEE